MSLSIPTLEAFLAAPPEMVRDVAPQTVVWGAGGTRRRAVLEGISPATEEYAQWTRGQMIAGLRLLFEHGIRHVIAVTLIDGSYREVTPGYRERLAAWTEWGLAGPESVAAYGEMGCRARLIGAEGWPELLPTAGKLQAATPQSTGPTVWYSVAADAEGSWEQILRVARETQAESRADLVRALYGEEIAPATLYLGSGKPRMVASEVPPLLMGKMHCYWRQHLGYDLDVETLRRILYDYAYVRPTWVADKSTRAQQVLAYADAWQEPPVIGLGTRLGPFWYPAAMPTWQPDEEEAAATVAGESL